MKNLAVVMGLLLMIGCAHSPLVQKEPIERGWIDRTVLDRPEHEPFKAGYDSANVDERLAGMIRQVKEGVDIVVILGTWCPDSRREVPRFLKVADAAGIAPARIRLYAVDRSKMGDDGVPQSYTITLVPTFIFLKGGKEIGRIVEKPETTMAGDVLAIMAKGQ